MIQFLLGLILIVLVIGFFGEEIKSDAVEIGSGVADIFGSMPPVTHIMIGFIIMAVCIANAIKIIRNR